MQYEKCQVDNKTTRDKKLKIIVNNPLAEKRFQI